MPEEITTKISECVAVQEEIKQQRKKLNELVKKEKEIRNQIFAIDPRADTKAAPTVTEHNGSFTAQVLKPKKKVIKKSDDEKPKVLTFN
jgi:uncharacterized coiled-coil DUF342 family protein